MSYLPHVRPGLAGYLLAVVTVIVAFGLRVVLLPVTGTGAPFVLFFAALVITNIFAGPRAGLLALALSAPLGAYVFVVRADYTMAQAVAQGTLFVIDGVIVSYLSFLLNRAIRSAEASAEHERRAVSQRDDLMATVSHDLRNPLSAIDLRLQVLKRGAGSLDHAAIEKHVTALQSTVSSMSRLITDLLDAARIEHGRLHLEPTDESASSLVSEALAALQPLAETRSLRLERGDVPSLDVRCDRARVLQVLQNLLGNAIKFTAQGGRVSVAARRVGDWLELEIADTGPGIPEAQLPHVFDRYWQAQRVSRQGTGLGLAIVKGIVEAHGGRVSATSRIGEGTAFTFTLPLAHRPSDTPSFTSSEEGDGHAAIEAEHARH